MRTGSGPGVGSSNDEVMAAIAATAEVARFNQTTATSGKYSEDTNNGSANPDTESKFTTEVCYSSNIYTNICSVCFKVDVTTCPPLLEEANLTYMLKVQVSQN